MRLVTEQLHDSNEHQTEIHHLAQQDRARPEEVEDWLRAVPGPSRRGSGPSKSVRDKVNEWYYPAVSSVVGMTD